MKVIDETGNRYGRLLVLSRSEKMAGTKATWECKCDCGNKTIVDGDKLRRNHTRSCGCYHKDRNIKHGLHGSKIYNAYISMINRCYNEKNENYKNYGGRGITVCDRWKSSLEDFISDMGESDKGLSIERIDTNGNYEPNNCKWATQKDQARNKRNNNIIEFNGEKMCESAWAEYLNIKRSTLRNRLTIRGWSIEKSLTTPVRYKSSSRTI